MLLILCLCWCAGDVQGYRNRSLPGTSWPEDHPGGELPHHPYWGWSSQQGQCDWPELFQTDQRQSLLDVCYNFEGLMLLKTDFAHFEIKV